MEFSIEAIIAIIALLVALPPVVVILVKLFRRHRSRGKAEQEIRRGQSWHSVRMTFNDGGQRRVFEVMRNQQPQELIDLESVVLEIGSSRASIPCDQYIR
ncbi:hypothetical protein F5X97DRAFT_306414 [Nemania serpens]|nr:hypothetical protein F5X97DRAFT_306414 [Nemania serpens]